MTYVTRAIGFTGTRDGMTAAQGEVLRFLLEHFRPSEFHHGMCPNFGADLQAHRMVLAHKLAIKIVGHPMVWPNGEFHRSYEGVENVVRLAPYPPLTRNRHIVAACEAILATPKEYTEQLRSGTWATIRYAKGKCLVIYPDGRVELR